MLQSRAPTWPRSSRSLLAPPAAPTRVCGRLARCTPAVTSLVQESCRLIARFKIGEDAGNASQEPQTGVITGASPVVPVVFELCKHCPFGQSFALVGDTPQLGQWDISKAVRLEWSEGDVWRGQVSVPLDTPVSIKYVELADDGGLVAWGQDLAGGSNISLMVSGASGDDVSSSGLSLTMEPADAADTSHQPYLVAHLDTSAILPESAARAKEAQQQAERERGTDATTDGQPGGQDTSSAAAAGVTVDAAPVSDVPAVSDPAEADAIMAADDVDMDRQQQLPRGWTASADYSPPAPQQQDRQHRPEAEAEAEAEGPISNVSELQLEDSEEQDLSTATDDGDGDDGAPHGADAALIQEGDQAQSEAVAAVVSAPTMQGCVEATSESVQDLGLHEHSGVADGEGLQDTFTAAAGAEVAIAQEVAAAGGSGVSAGGVGAGFEDEGSMGDAVAGGLMEAGDDETIAGGVRGPTDTNTPAPTPEPAGGSSSQAEHHTTARHSGFKGYMVTSMDPEDLETDDVIGHDTTTAQADITHSPSDEAKAVTAQESARLASAHHASTEQQDAINTAATNDSRGSLEGLPTPAGGDSAAVANTLLGPELKSVIKSDACRPANPHGKLVTAGPSISTVDEDALLQDPTKAITELDSSKPGVEPIDSYEDMFGAFATAAATAAAASHSWDSGDHHHELEGAAHGREGSAQAAQDRSLQLAKSEEGPTTGTAGGAAVDGERTGTWTAEAAQAAAAAADSDSSQAHTRTTEDSTSASSDSTEQAEARAVSPSSSTSSSSGKQFGGNWLQRLFGGGGDQGGRA